MLKFLSDLFGNAMYERSIDLSGRVGIPKEFRDLIGVENGGNLQITTVGKAIIIKKA